MSLAAAAGLPPPSAIASAFVSDSGCSMPEFNHSLSASSTVVYAEQQDDGTLVPMHDLPPVGPRLKAACKERFGGDGDTPAARAFLCRELQISPAAVSKLFLGTSASLSVANVFAVSQLLHVDARWLATGQGEMRPSQLPTDVSDVARLLHGISDPSIRKMAVGLAHDMARNPAEYVSGRLEARRWSPDVQAIADRLESLEPGQLKDLALAWATTAAFNPDRLLREDVPALTPRRRATDKRPAKP